MPAETIGLDLGTSYVKAARFSDEGRQLALATREVELETDDPGHATLDPRAVRAAAEACLSEVDAGSAAAIGCSGAMHTLLWVDGHGDPSTRVSTWMDTSAREEAEHLRQDASDWWARTGVPVHPMSPAVRLWAQSKGGHPPAGRPMALKDWLMLSWTGQAVTDMATAAASGLLNRVERQWDAKVLKAIGLGADDLPAIGRARDVVGRFKGTPVVLGTTDGMATQIGLGARGDAGSISLGTSGALRRVVQEEGQSVADRGLFAYAVGPHETLIGGALSDAGNLVTWWSRMTGASVADLLAEAIHRGPPEDDLMVVPTLHGARAPAWPLRATGCFEGLEGHHDRADLSAAVVDGILLSLGIVGRSVESVLGPASSYHTAGGLFRAKGLAQWTADVLGRPVVLHPVRDASVLGAAALARHAHGHAPFMGPEVERFLPRPERAEASRLARLADRLKAFGQFSDCV